MNSNLDAWFDIQSKKLDRVEQKTKMDAITGKKLEKRKAWAKVMNWGK